MWVCRPTFFVGESDIWKLSYDIFWLQVTLQNNLKKMFFASIKNHYLFTRADKLIRMKFQKKSKMLSRHLANNGQFKCVSKENTTKVD